MRGLPPARSRIVLRSSHRSLSPSSDRTIAPLRAAARRPFPVAGFAPRPAPGVRVVSESDDRRDAELDENPQHRKQRRGRGARRKHR